MTTFPACGRQPAAKADGEQSSGTSRSLPAQHHQLAGPQVKTALTSHVSLRMKSQF